MAEKKVPKATAKRFPAYLKYLRMLEGENILRINSTEFSNYTSIPSATIRRDFTYIGELGRSGYGYDVKFLIETFERFLQTDEKKYIAIVGCGNLGRAFLRNNFRRNTNIVVSCAFDTNPIVIGEFISGIRVYDMKEFSKIATEKNISLAITTVPSQFAKEAIEQVVAAGVNSILNFAPVVMELPENVNMQTIDLTNEVQTLLYFGE